MGPGSSAVRTTRPGQSSSRRTSAATPASPVFATSTTGRSPSPRPSEARRIQASNAAITASPSGNTSGWSHSAEVRTMTSGRYGSKLPAYSSASTTNSTPDPRRAVAAIPMPVMEAGRSAPTNAPGSPPAPTSAWTSQPEVVLFPCVPATAISTRPAAASATTCCQGSSGIPRARAARSSGLSGSIAVSALVTASRPGCGSRVTWAASWVAGDHDPGRIQRRRVLRGSPGVASIDLGARPGGEQRRRRGARALGSHHVDAFSGPDRPRRSGGLESGADLGRAAHAHARSSRTLTQVPPVPPARGASPGPPRRSRACSRRDPRATGTAGPPPGRARRRRHTRGPPAWTRSLHRGPPPP